MSEEKFNFGRGIAASGLALIVGGFLTCSNPDYNNLPIKRPSETINYSRDPLLTIGYATLTAGVVGGLYVILRKVFNKKD